jgi:hypothetical protein
MFVPQLIQTYLSSDLVRTKAYAHKKVRFLHNLITSKEKEIFELVHAKTKKMQIVLNFYQLLEHIAVDHPTKEIFMIYFSEAEML